MNFLFFTTLFFITSLKFVKSMETVFNITASKSSTFIVKTVFNITASKSSTFIVKTLKLVGTLTNLLMSSLLTPAFKAKKKLLAAKLDVSTPVACFDSF